MRGLVHSDHFVLVGSMKMLKTACAHIAKKSKVKLAMPGQDHHEPMWRSSLGMTWTPDGIAYESDHRLIDELKVKPRSERFTPAVRESRNAKRKSEGVRGTTRPAPVRRTRARLGNVIMEAT